MEPKHTRDGAFKVGPDGQITTADALPIAAGLQIDPEVTNVFVSPTGKFLSKRRTELRLLGNWNLFDFQILLE